MQRESVNGFRASLGRADDYPFNLLRPGSNTGALAAHRRLFDQDVDTLLQDKSAVPVLEFTDRYRPGDRAREWLITSESELLAWLRIPPAETRNNEPQATALSRQRSSSGASATVPHTDAICSFIFFQSKTSEQPLKVSRRLLTLILTYFNVMPAYLDFMTVFAVRQDEAIEILDRRFSGFKQRVQLSPFSRGPKLPFLGWSGMGYELTYALKSVANKSAIGPVEDWGDKPDWYWSERQAVFYHHFDVITGKTIWIVTSARDDIQRRVQGLMGGARAEDCSFDSVTASFLSSLAVHLVFAQWASEDWRGYIRWLEQVLEQQTRNTLRSVNFLPEAEDISFIQDKEDKANKSLLMLSANVKTLQLLVDFYQLRMKTDSFHLGKESLCREAVEDFALQIEDQITAFKFLAERAKTLSKITTDRKALVQQHIQAFSTQKMEILTSAAQREAVVMRVIGVLTLVYLPATFVSTFFSTDIVKYQDRNDDGIQTESYSPLALERWWEVTAPLTLVTALTALAWFYKESIRERMARMFGRRQPLDVQDEEKTI